LAHEQYFGVIIETDQLIPGKSVRVTVRASNGRIFKEVVRTRVYASLLLGEFVLLQLDDGKFGIKLRDFPGA
jgi:hypothetical protein